MIDTDIIVSCEAGIGNRFYSLFTTHDIFLRHGIRFKYWWPIQKNTLETEITDLFESNQFQIVESLHRPEEGRHIKKKGDWILDDVDLEKMPIYWDTPIARWHTDPPLSSLKNAFNSVKVKDDIIDKVNSIDVTNRIGIHVRGGDLKIENSHEDDSRFVDNANITNMINYINDILKQNKDQLFFGSCEDEEDKDILEKEFGSSIIQLQNCKHARSSVKSIKNAFANLILLSKCAIIIGNIGSSFAGFSALIGEIKYINLK